MRDSSSNPESNSQTLAERLRHIKLNAEEVATLRQCNVKIGLNAIIGTLVGLGIHHFTATRFIPKLKKGFLYTISGSLGFFWGTKIAARECREKILSLRDSVLANELRRYNGLSPISDINNASIRRRDSHQARDSLPDSDNGTEDTILQSDKQVLVSTTKLDPINATQLDNGSTSSKTREEFEAKYRPKRYNAYGDPIDN